MPGPETHIEDADSDCRCPCHARPPGRQCRPACCVTCNWCGRNIKMGRLQVHESVCPDRNPDTEAFPP